MLLLNILVANAFFSDYFTETDEEIQSVEKHKETIEIQHSEPQPQTQEVPETTRVTKTFQVTDQQDDSIIIPEETTHTEAIRIDRHKQTIVVPEEGPAPERVLVEKIPTRKRPGSTIEIHVGVPKTTPSTTETVTETTTYTTITSEIQVLVYE